MMIIELSYEVASFKDSYGEYKFFVSHTEAKKYFDEIKEFRSRCILKEITKIDDLESYSNNLEEIGREL